MEVAAKPKPAPNAYAAPALDQPTRVGRLIRRFSHGSRRFFLLAMGLLIVEAAAAIAALYALAYLVDYLAASKPALPPGSGLSDFLGSRASTALALAVALLLSALLNSVAASQAQRALTKGGRQLGLGLRAALQSQLQTLSLAFYGQRRTSALLAQIADDIASLERFAVGSLHNIGGAVGFLALALAALCLISWPIALLVLGASMLLAAVSAYFADRISIATTKLDSRDAELAAGTHTMLTTISDGQAQGRGDHQSLGELGRRSLEAAVEADTLRALSSGATQMLHAFVLALVGLIGAWSVGRGELSVGALVFCLVLVAGMFKPIRRIAGVWDTVGELSAAVQRIGEVLNRDPTAVDRPGAVVAPRFRGAIAFRNVSFAYQPEAGDGAQAGDASPQLALRDVSFDVAAGEALALVSDEGAGKSAIVQLLPRLYDPHAGQIAIDGRDIREFTLDSLRAQISLVSWDVPQLNGSVAEAIAQGRGSLPRETIIAAAMQANAHEFIERLPNGYDTPLGEHAANLSGGQRQRLAIARAFIRNAPILILDEPTAGLDAGSADLVLLALRTLMKGKTTIIVSHELDLLRCADRVVVIAHHGQVAQVGSHKALLRAGGLYADLYASQLQRAEGDRAVEREITSEMSAVAAGDKAAPLSPKNFHVMIQQAIPRPLAPQAFQTLQIHAVQPGSRSEAPLAGQAQGAPTSEGARMSAVPLPAPLSAPPPSDNATIVMPQVSRHPAQGGPTPTNGMPPGALSALVAPAIPADARERGDNHPALARAQLDPLQSGLLERELPGLKAALDEQAMRAYMQEALFGDDRARYTVARCIPGKATYVVGQGCRLRYQLEVKDAASGQSLLPLVNARVFAQRQQCDLYLRDHLAPLAELMRGRDEIAPFVTPAATLGPLNMTVAVFPIDGDLPALVAATDRQALSAILNETLPAPEEGGFGLDDLRVDLAHYARRGRCVLRYTLYAHDLASMRRWHQVVYGKLSSEGNGAALGALSAALQQQVRQNPRAFQFSLPRVWDYRADMQLVLLEALSGVPQLGQLLKQRLRGMDDDDEEALALEDALTVAASVASALHAARIPARRRTLDHELAELRAEIDAVGPMAPDLSAHMRHWLRRIEAYAEESDPLPYCLCHGNFKHTKLIFDGSDVGLIDIDDLCQAEPALDLGHFQAYLRIVAQKTQRLATFAPSAITDQLCAHFLEGYLGAAGDMVVDGERLRVRVSIYEAVTLLRAVVHSWQILKTSRIEHVIAVLEERLACLPALDY